MTWVGSTSRLRLGDGRQLGVLALGDPTGFPVIHNHGGLSSRLDVVAAHRAAVDRGIRIISPDRPGIATSDSQPGRTLDDWATDVAEMADILDLGSFAVMGWSLGGSYAQSVAHHLGDRTVALALIASAIPRQWQDMRGEINSMDRRFMTLSASAPGRLVSRSAFATVGSAARRFPITFAKLAHIPATAAPEIAAAVAEGLTHPRGVVEEYRILDSPWSFDPNELTAPTRIWQGDRDDLVPLIWGQRLEEAIAGSILTIVRDGTHFLATDHWDDILNWIVQITTAQH